MKKPNALFLIIICAAFVTVALTTGCGESMDQMGDEPDFTADFLSGEYAAQLIKDGALVIFGVITAITEDEDGVITVEISEREYVEAQNHPDGYFIADKNLDSIHYLSSEASATFIPGGLTIPRAMKVDEFISVSHEDRLYDVYIMGEQIELLIARYLP